MQPEAPNGSANRVQRQTTKRHAKDSLALSQEQAHAAGRKPTALSPTVTYMPVCPYHTQVERCGGSAWLAWFEQAACWVLGRLVSLAWHRIHHRSVRHGTKDIRLRECNKPIPVVPAGRFDEASRSPTPKGYNAQILVSQLVAMVLSCRYRCCCCCCCSKSWRMCFPTGVNCSSCSSCRTCSHARERHKATCTAGQSCCWN